ncbi:MAG: RNA polymerase sigma factor [Solirubrobacteraceae bacterium]
MGPRRADWDWEQLRAVALRETRRMLDPDSAQDAAQEAIMRAWRNAGSCVGPNPLPWVRTIARREALRIIARRSPDRLCADDYPAADEDAELTRAADRVDVARGMAKLADDEQRAILLHYWAGRSDREIATMLDAPVGTIKIRLHRARHKLAQGLR